jgi:prevent-host-death family protein
MTGSGGVARTIATMTLHRNSLKPEVGVRELHARLSRHVQHVKDGGEVVVTMRGRRVARLVPSTRLTLWQNCAPAAWYASRRRRAARARDEHGSRPPGPCPTSSQSNGADRLPRYVGARQADLRRTRLPARRRALGSRRAPCREPARLPRGTRSAAAARGGRIGPSTHGSAVATLEDLYAQLRSVAID